MNDINNELHFILKDKGYKKINFRISKTQHLLIKVRLNGILGDFILDTGASTSCVDFSVIEHFNLMATSSQTTASGAGAINMATKIANNNSLSIGRWKTDNTPIIIFDLSHVNAALDQYKVKPVHGIIGADILMRSHAIIDYANKKLFLR